MKGGKREGAGRPLVLVQRVSKTFRLDPEALRRLEAGAAAEGLPPSRYLDHILLGEDAR